MTSFDNMGLETFRTPPEPSGLLFQFFTCVLLPHIYKLMTE